jgi:hypothetical protein
MPNIVPRLLAAILALLASVSAEAAAVADARLAQPSLQLSRKHAPFS